jgi:acyl carrier protein
MQTIEELIPRLKSQIIERLHMDDMDPAELDEEMPLFGPITGLDSIDALELVVLLDLEYDIKIKDSKTARKILFNIRTMAEFIRQNGNP